MQYVDEKEQQEAADIIVELCAPLPSETAIRKAEAFRARSNRHAVLFDHFHAIWEYAGILRLRELNKPIVRN